MERAPETSAEEAKLLATVLDTGQTLEEELQRIKRRFRLDEKPVFLMDLVANGEARLQAALEGIAKALAADRVLESQDANGLVQVDEIKAAFLEGPGLTLLVDTRYRLTGASPGLLHSHDQVLVGESTLARDLERVSAAHGGGRILLIRFFDASRPEELKMALGLNHFLDSSIRMTGK